MSSTKSLDYTVLEREMTDGLVHLQKSVLAGEEYECNSFFERIVKAIGVLSLRGEGDWAVIVQSLEDVTSNLAAQEEIIPSSILRRVVAPLQGVIIILRAIYFSDVPADLRSFVDRSKLALPILQALASQGPQGFNELLRALDIEVNPNVLTYNLSNLVKWGVVIKGSDKRSPYAITRLGQMVLEGPSDALKALALTELQRRKLKASEINRVVNEFLPADALRHYYCVSCGLETQQLPPGHGTRERKYLCDECQPLSDRGWI